MKRKYRRGLIRATYNTKSWFIKQPIKIHPLAHKQRKRSKKLFRGALKRVRLMKEYRPLKKGRYKIRKDKVIFM